MKLSLQKALVINILLRLRMWASAHALTALVTAAKETIENQS